MIVDSHCHLDNAHLYNQLDEVVKRAQLNQIKYLLTICTTLESFEKIKLIVKQYSNIYGTFGIHPHESDKYKNVIEKVKETPEVIQCFSTTGMGSLMLWVATENSQTLEELLRNIQSWPNVTRTETQVILSAYKTKHQLPIK